MLIIACPCALGLATPTALWSAPAAAPQLGILIKGPEVLESTRRVDTVVLDKTGTVTTGRMALVDVVAADGTDAARRCSRLAAAARRASLEHPVASAIAAASGDDGDHSPVEVVRQHRGLGVEGVVDGRSVVAGRAPTLLAEYGPCA